VTNYSAIHPVFPHAPLPVFFPACPCSHLALSKSAAQWICINKKQSAAAIILAINI
jgi:hypothetical protein